MKKHSAISRFRNFAIFIVAFAAMGAFAQQVPATIKLVRGDQIIQGQMRWVASTGKYEIQYRPNPQSTGVTTGSYAPADIADMNIQKPATFDQLMTQVRGANPDSAIPG